MLAMMAAGAEAAEQMLEAGFEHGNRVLVPGDRSQRTTPPVRR
jgi:hypothetical protein